MRTMASVLGLCSALCWLGCPAATPASQSGRPAEAGSGDVVARVLLLQGEARATAANGVSFALQPDCPLLRTDRISVPAGGLVVLALQNNYLVAVDEDQEMPIGSLAMLDEPPSHTSISQQLADLLRERNISAPERLAGWRQGMVGAETVPVQPERDRQLESTAKKIDQVNASGMSAIVTGLRATDETQKAQEREQDKLAPPSPPPPAPESPTRRERKPAPPPSASDVQGPDALSGGGGGTPGAPRQLARSKLAPMAPLLRVVRWAVSDGKSQASRPPDELPGGLLKTLQGPEAAACFQQVRTKTRTVRIEVEISDGAVRRVRAPAARAAGPCLQKVLGAVEPGDLGSGKRLLSIDIALP